MSASRETGSGNRVGKSRAAGEPMRGGMSTLIRASKQSKPGGEAGALSEVTHAKTRDMRRAIASATNRATTKPDAMKRNGPDDKASGTRDVETATGSGPCERASKEAWRYGSTVIFISSWRRRQGKPHRSRFHAQDRCVWDGKQPAGRKSKSSRKRRDSPEHRARRHSGNSLMPAMPLKRNRTFCRGLPRDIIHEFEMHRFIQAHDASNA